MLVAMTDSVLESCAAVFDHAAIAARRLRDLLPQPLAGAQANLAASSV
jgi:hypothetical protein